jgi:hypothetical protein
LATAARRTAPVRVWATNANTKAGSVALFVFHSTIGARRLVSIHDARLRTRGATGDTRLADIGWCTCQTRGAGHARPRAIAHARGARRAGRLWGALTDAGDTLTNKGAALAFITGIAASAWHTRTQAAVAGAHAAGGSIHFGGGLANAGTSLTDVFTLSALVAGVAQPAGRARHTRSRAVAAARQSAQRTGRAVG